MNDLSPPVRPRLEPVGSNPTAVWGMDHAERVRRIATAQGLDGDGPARLLANLRYAFDPNWTRYLAERPGSAMTLNGVPVLVHSGDPAVLDAARAAMAADAADLPPGLEVLRAEDEAGIPNPALRKRERSFVEPLVPANLRRIERASYYGAYKGVTDVLTKYLWPEWAFVMTRWSAALGITPNGVTAAGTVLCVAATVLFWYGWFWTGLLAGLVFMVLDTVDGKLARCTITSSALGNAWDHGIDLVHPPFWWWAWAVGCVAYGTPLSNATFWWVMAVMLAGYVLQRLIEGAFIARFGMHIHVWERFDSWFRLWTARRNPNMILLFASLLAGRPDWGIVAVAGWTAISLVVHLVRLIQAAAARRPIVSWLD